MALLHNSTTSINITENSEEILSSLIPQNYTQTRHSFQPHVGGRKLSS